MKGLLKADIFLCPDEGASVAEWLAWLESVGAVAGDGGGGTPGCPLDCRANSLDEAARGFANGGCMYVRGPDGDRFRGDGLAKLASGEWIAIDRADVAEVTTND